MKIRKGYVRRSYGNYNITEQSARFYREMGHLVSHPFKIKTKKHGEVWAIDIGKKKLKKVI